MEECCLPCIVIGPCDRAPFFRDALAFLDNLILISAYKGRVGEGRLSPLVSTKRWCDREKIGPRMNADKDGFG